MSFPVSTWTEFVFFVYQQAEWHMLLKNMPSTVFLRISDLKLCKLNFKEILSLQFKLLSITFSAPSLQGYVADKTLTEPQVLQ